MQDNLRLLFSALWFPATGSLFATTVLFAVTLGGYWEYLLMALCAWVVCTTVILVTSLS